MSDGELIAAFARMDGGQVENLRGIEIADAGDSALIEQSDLDGARAGLEPLPKFFSREGQGVWSQAAAAEFVVKLLVSEQLDRAESATVPVPNVRDGSVGKVETKTKVLGGGWVGDEHQPCHSRFENEPVVVIELQNDALADAANLLNGATDEPARGCGYIGLYGNRPPRTLRAFRANDAAAGNGGDSPPHGFDFRQFGHGKE